MTVRLVVTPDFPWFLATTRDLHEVKPWLLVIGQSDLVALTLENFATAAQKIEVTFAVTSSHHQEPAHTFKPFLELRSE